MRGEGQHGQTGGPKEREGTPFFWEGGLLGQRQVLVAPWNFKVFGQCLLNCSFSVLPGTISGVCIKSTTLSSQNRMAKLIP